MQTPKQIVAAAAALTLAAGAADLASGAINYMGVFYGTTGGATASENADGRLVVSNIGASADDGVLFDLGESEGVRLGFAQPPTPPEPAPFYEYGLLLVHNGGVGSGSTLQEDLVIQIAPESTAGGSGDDVLIGMRGSDIQPVHFEGFRGGVRVATGDINDSLDPDDLTTVASFPDPSMPPVVDAIAWRNVENDGAAAFRVEIQFESDTLVALPGASAPELIDTLVLIDDEYSGAPVGGLHIRGVDVGEILIDDIAVQYFGRFHRAEGAAQLMPGAGGETGIEISNIGATGDDGVEVRLDPYKNFKFIIKFDGAAGATDYDLWTANFGTTAPASTARTQTDDNGGMLLAVATVDAPCQTVRFFDGAQLLHEFDVCNADDLANPAPVAMGQTYGDAGEQTYLAVELVNVSIQSFGFKTHIEFAPGNGSGPGSFFADRVEVHAPLSKPQSEWKYVNVRRTAMGETPGSFTILEETSTPPCPADLNGDGVVDGADLAGLLTAWGGAGSPADINADGVVDGGDLATLLAAWGPCP